MLLWSSLLLLFILCWVILYRLARSSYLDCTSYKMEGLRLQLLAPPMLYVLNKIQVAGRFPIFFFKIQRSVQKLSGARKVGDYTLIFLAEMLNYSYLFLVAGCIFSLCMGGDGMGFGLGCSLAVLVPLALIADLRKKVMIREQQIILELPELLSKIILLVGAGETVQKAIRLCLDRKKGQAEHPLYKELFQMSREMDSGYSFQQAIEAFSKRCAIQEVSSFSTAVLLNFKRGGQDFVLCLKDLSYTLWEKRKAVSRTRGEQASSKLVFPMVLLFVIIVILMGAPAFMAMSL
ncbi:tight adherence protein C [Paenibacillus shirakamiensis]|uniref:Tight adherence protein C n=1 Tax=Paenibacillus shirakamiensis TaxID=1265935 RepID=A0ABS4JFS6_9BACL|nr:type II secretion system F family protein [Paenibacillus shirakamiensis]MBP2000557.1 tight adherence protein C [Paenibacillus shirakamiensis]